MKIIIDADACPVTALAVKYADEKGIPCILVCDNTHSIEYETAETIVVDKGADSADCKIANIIEKGDIAVTQDYGLAALCLGKKAKVLNQNGLIYTDQNIETLLYTRYANKKIMNAGKRIKGPSKRTKENDDAFMKSLKKLVKC